MKITVEVKTPRIARTWSRKQKLVAIILVCLGLMVPVVALGDDNFSDVPASAFYHNAVNAIFGARITTGIVPPPNGQFAPNNTLTRGEMAVFLWRSMGRAGSVKGTPQSLPTDGTTVDLATLTVKPGEATGGTSAVLVDAAWSAKITGTAGQDGYYAVGCPCIVEVWIRQDGTANESLHTREMVGVGLAPVIGATGVYEGHGAGANTATFTVPTGTNASFTVRGRLYGGSGAIQLQAAASAVYAPLGPLGVAP